MDQSSLMIHRIRFFTYEPTSINFMSYNEEFGRIALLRKPIRRYKSVNSEPCIIEIWNLQEKAFFLEQRIYEDPDQLNLLEGLAWHPDGRLFSVGLNSYLNEYDLLNGHIIKSYCINDPGWCLAIDSKTNLIAVGTEKGYVSVFEIIPTGLQFQKIIYKNEHRILCIEWSWHNNNLFLVCGSIDFIKIIDYNQGKCVDFIKVGNNNVVVWCLKVLKDFTIVSGDSNGVTSFWDGNTVTLIRSFYGHRADVLTLCASEDQNCIYSAGVDPSIVQFKRVKDKDNSWVHSWKRRPHTHDVRSIFITPNWLFSGGIDGFFSKLALKASTHVRHLTNLMNNVALVCKNQQNYLALMYEKSIQIWKLGSPTDLPPQKDLTLSKSDTFIKRLRIMDNAMKLLDINSRKSLIAFDFNAEWLIYANYNNMKIVTWSENKIEKIKLLHNPISNISNIHIINENLMAITYGKKFDIFKLDTFGVVLEKSNVAKSRIIKICSSRTRIILEIINYIICIYDLNNYTMLNTLNKYNLACAVQVNRFSPNEKLWLAYTNSLLIEYDLETLSENVYFLHRLNSKKDKKCQHFNKLCPIKQIAFAKQSVLLSDDNNLYRLNLEKHRIAKCGKYHHPIFMKNIDEKSLVIVEITPSMIMENLPPMLTAKAYGT